MIKSIAIEKNDKAFLPEAYAYRDYFRQHGYICEFVNENSKEALGFDAIILFHGFHPFWKKYPKFVISEYHSLSTGKANRLKDFLKRVVNVKGDLYIFLNKDVRKKLWFSQKTNYITRGMGYPNELVINKPEEKLYDVVYCGSNRPGVVDKINNLANIGLKIVVVGFNYDFNHSNINSFGRVAPPKVMSIISQARYGLNYTPDIFPLNIQDSTKVIEYSAAGLGVITNKYKWVSEFEKSTGAHFLDIDIIKSYEDVAEFNFKLPSISSLSWPLILKSSNILKKYPFSL